MTEQPLPLAPGVLPTRRGGLFRKYVVICVVLVSGALLTSGVVEAYFVYTENQAVVVRLQSERAAAAASAIEQFLRETEHVLGWAALPSPTGVQAPEQRRSDFERLLQLAPSIQEISYLDGTGTEQVWVARQTRSDHVDHQNHAQDAWFTQARARGMSISADHTGDGVQPTALIALAERGTGQGVVVASLSLDPVEAVVSQASSTDAGRTYVVDSDGHLIAHPDASLVEQRTDLSSSPQVRAVRAGPFQGRKQLGSTEVVDSLAPSVMVVSQFNPNDQWVHGSSRDWLVAYKVIEPAGWIVFVDQPLDQAFASVREPIARTALLLLLGLVPAVLASMLLVRRMLTPLQALQAGAARIGQGALDQRIDVHTGDEIETLADQFNAMAAQLEESYADLEQKVEDRTREVEEKSRELEQASQHKSEFLANMSHELRTPLNAIIGFSEVLTERMFGELNERQDEYLNDILSSGRHLLSLINDILDLSKVEAGRMDLELGRFSLREALENGLTMLRERAGNHGIALALEVAPTVDVIAADERKVKQIVFNLLSNAVKFTPDGGKVELSAQVMDGVLTLAVRDTGIGIASEEQAQVFEEFRQVGLATSQKHEGTGLGLALCRRFVELHGGQIWVESEPGVGSTFSFTLPHAFVGQTSGPVPDLTSGTPELPAQSDSVLERRASSILVIEDDPSSVELLSVHLHGAGFEVVVARDGAEGLELARRIRPSGIVLDLVLPRVDGWDVLAQAKADAMLRETPIVVVSMLDERGRGFALGAADYLLKPIDAGALLDTLRRVVRTVGEQVTVLAIDDDPLATELLRVSLSPAGFTILTAGGGSEGLEMALQAQPDLIILDLMMPDVDGFAVIEGLRADQRTAAIPIVVLTSKSMTAEEKARLNGQISHLARKSEFDRAELLALIHRLCPTAA